MANTNNNANNDPLSSALGINPLPVPLTPMVNQSVQKLLDNAHDDSATTDFESARANISTIIETTQDAIFKLSQLAESSQSPRAFEVLAKLIESGLKANQELLNLQTKIREIKNADSPVSEKAKTVNNNLFVGSTTDLQKMIQDMNKK